MEFCFNSEVVTKVTLQPIERFDFDAAIIFSDILTIPHFLGQTVTFEKGHGPILAKVNWANFLKDSEQKDLSDQYQPLFKSIGDVKNALASDKALIGFAGPRVIEQTVREKLPEGFQRSEFLMQKGSIDMIVDRRQMRAEIAGLLALLQKLPDPINAVFMAGNAASVVTAKNG